MADLEDVYGCSSMQQGLLLSQIKNTGHYLYHSLFTVRAVNSAVSVDAKKLARAWAKVVQKHSSLRTVFIESVSQEGLMDQVVVKTASPKIVWLHCDSGSAEGLLMKQGAMSVADTPLCHQLTICGTTSGNIVCKLELSHAICDGTSIAIIFQDLVRYYGTDELKFDNMPLYRDYISYIQGQLA